MIPILAGGDDRARVARDHLDVLLLSGLIGKFVPLNGGSGTRADTRTYYRELASNLRLEFEGNGSFVKYGGPTRRGRGQRYVAFGERRLTWVHWRKAKRLLRKNIAEAA